MLENNHQHDNNQLNFKNGHNDRLGTSRHNYRHNMLGGVLGCTRYSDHDEVSKIFAGQMLFVTTKMTVL